MNEFHFVILRPKTEESLVRFFAALRMTVLAAGLSLSLSACATGRDLTSANYIPEWENKLFTLPAPSDTTGGRWFIQGSKKLAGGIGNVVLIPFALVGNVAVNAYYIPTWPVRRVIRGDKRLIVWYPIFQVGSTTGSDFYSKEWNNDLV